MPVRTIKTFPQDVDILRQKSVSVETVDGSILALIDDMIDTMLADKGIGLAAPQVGINQQVIVVSWSCKRDDVQVYINPEILLKEGNCIEFEGCLSVPGAEGEVERAEQVRLKYVTCEGEPVEESFEGFYARILQHEIDHLQGVLLLII